MTTPRPLQQVIDNHYVPQHYLQAWSIDGVRVPASRLLVSHDRVPLWKPRPIRGLARQAHLYTSVLGGAASDDFERWLAQDFEQPAIEAIDNVRDGRRMTPEHWRRLALYVAALDLRTPAAYAEHMQLFERIVSGAVERIMAELQQAIAAGKRFSFPPVGAPPRPVASGELPVFVRSEPAETEDGITLVVEVASGREAWLWGVRRLLTGVAKTLTQHRWRILRPPDGVEWMTSDHPVVRLNYYGDDRYDFKGGWGNVGTELLVPLSPQHLLITQVGTDRLRHSTASVEMAEKLNRFIVERAHRWVFAREPQLQIEHVRRRRVSEPAFRTEGEQWKTWHNEQVAALLRASALRSTSVKRLTVPLP